MRIHFFPTELGGPDDPENIGYITPEAAEARRRVIDTLRRLTDKGEVRRMEVTPDYRGDSFIPIRITFKAPRSHDGKPFEEVVEVW